MARNLPFTVAVTALLFSFTLATARYPLDLPENDVTSHDDNLANWSDSDPKVTATLILPSEKPESQPATAVEFESEETEHADSKLPEKVIGTSESIHERSETESDKTVPLTVVTFRPINRHFPRRPLIPFRRAHRCRGSHHHHNQFKPWGSSRFSGPQEVSYGSDMILSGGEDKGFSPVFNHGGNRLSFIKDEKREEMITRRHHNHHHDHDHEEGEEREHEHEHEGGFVKGIRKFLKHF